MKELESFSLCATGGRGGGFGHSVGGCCLLEWQALSDPQNFLTRKGCIGIICQYKSL